MQLSALQPIRNYTLSGQTPATYTETDSTRLRSQTVHRRGYRHFTQRRQ